jgi:hypothetical protein
MSPNLIDDAPFHDLGLLNALANSGLNYCDRFQFVLIPHDHLPPPFACLAEFLNL